MEFIELPMPVTIGGSEITGKRVTGPPAHRLPILRDLLYGDLVFLEDAPPPRRKRTVGPDKRQIWIEVDTERGRISGILGSTPGDEERLVVQHQGRRLHDIIAFRVLKVEVENVSG